jgi:serine/threonine-protein kinase
VKEEASFGAYRAVRKIGQGGMGEVYLGEHTLIGRRAAIKVLQRERAANGEALERFFTEARATSAMEDPGIVQIYDFGVTTTGVAYLVMEYLDGESLALRLQRRGRLSPHEAVRITRQLASSLAATHAAGIVHRDLKPENVFIVRDAEALGGERPKILDFGIAKLGDDQPARGPTRTGQMMGTPAYMSPEQCNDAGKIDGRTDIYSLGCVLFHMLTGRPPFDHKGVGATIAAHQREPAPVASTIEPDVPASLDPIVARCLAKRLSDRFATMQELQQACDAVLAELPAPPRSSPELRAPLASASENKTTTLGESVGETLGTTNAVRVGIWAGVAAVAVAIGVVLAVMTTRKSADDRPAAASPASAAPTPITVEPIPAPVPEPAAPAPTVPTPTLAPTPTPQDPPATQGTPAPATHPTTTPKKGTPQRPPKHHRDPYEDRT